MKKLWVVLVLFYSFALSRAQQQYQFSQYMFNQLSYNPAYAGSQDQIEVDGLFRQQWWGFPGAPVTSTFNVNAAIKPFGTQGGIGLSIINDKYGVTNDLSLAATYAYRISLGNGKLAFGGKFGFMNDNTTYSKLTTEPQPTDIPYSDDKGNAFPDIDLGVYYNTDKSFFGVASQHITNPTVKFRSQGINYAITRTYSTIAGYKYQFSNPLYELDPSLFILSDLKVTYYDISSLLYYNKRLWGGLSYRSGNSLFGNAIVIFLGLELKNGLKIGYSYDVVTSAIRSYNIGTHEITLRYGFKLNNEKIPMKYKSIRFL